jgi:hypothetical protein
LFISLVPFFIESLSARKKAPPEDHREQVVHFIHFDLSRAVQLACIARGIQISERSTSHKLLMEFYHWQSNSFVHIWKARYRCNSVCVVGRMHSDAKGWSNSFIEKRWLYCVGGDRCSRCWDRLGFMLTGSTNW